MKKFKIDKYEVRVYNSNEIEIQQEYDCISIGIDELRELLKECESLIDKENES